MQETTVICDCCGNGMEEPNDSVLEGELIHAEESMPIVLEDLCEPCSEALGDAISDVIKRRESK